MPKQKLSPMGTGSKFLRRKAGWSTRNGDALPSVQRKANIFRVPQRPELCEVDSNDFSLPQRKLRLKTGTSDSGESIEQAVGSPSVRCPGYND